MSLLKANLKYTIRTIYSEYQEFGLRRALNSAKSEVVYPFKRFITFVKKLFAYGKLLWFDFEFDYLYLLRILQFKMRLMADFFETKGITVSAPTKAKELRMCIHLIDRIIEDNYDEIPMNKLEEQYGELQWESTPTKNPRAYQVHIYRKRAPEGTPEYEDERKRTSTIMKYAETQRQRDIDYLFDTMKKRLLGWWD